MREEDLLHHWGKELFYLIDDPRGLFNGRPLRNDNHDYNELEIFAMRDLGDKKKMTSTLAFIRDVYKLTNKGRGKGKHKVLENLKSEHFSIQDIMNNGLMSLLDLGFLYSILALAYSERDQLKKDIKWSSKIETSYLHADYKKLFSELDRSYHSYGQFNPTIKFVY